MMPRDFRVLHISRSAVSTRSWGSGICFDAFMGQRDISCFRSVSPAAGQRRAHAFAENALSEAHHSSPDDLQARCGREQRTATGGRSREATMMTLNAKTIRQAGLTLAFVLSFSALSTQGFAFSAEAQQMCTGDAFRLCGSEIPDVSRITACMIKQRASLSTGCRTVLDRDLTQQSSKVAAK
jgi:hypothetical protein